MVLFQIKQHSLLDSKPLSLIFQYGSATEWIAEGSVLHSSYKMVLCIGPLGICIYEEVENLKRRPSAAGRLNWDFLFKLPIRNIAGRKLICIKHSIFYVLMEILPASAVGNLTIVHISCSYKRRNKWKKMAMLS